MPKTLRATSKCHIIRRSIDVARYVSTNETIKRTHMADGRWQNKYRIESARAIWHDYDGGIYFITICTKNREHFFGEIENGIMVLSDIGKYADEQFNNVSSHYPYAEIPLWTIMPNHLHAIVVISACRDVARNVLEKPTAGYAACNVSQTESICSDGDVARYVSTNPTDKNEYMAERSPKQGSLAVIIRGIKSSITKFANENNIDFSWQPRFHDHIIRDTSELNRITSYIENNVANWKDDEFYTP